MSHCRSELHKEAVINIDLSSTCLISLGGYLLISETGVNLDLTNVIYFKKKKYARNLWRLCSLKLKIPAGIAKCFSNRATINSYTIL